MLERQFLILLFRAVDFCFLMQLRLCVPEAFFHLQPDLLCPTHEMALIKGCPVGTVLPLDPF